MRVGQEAASRLQIIKNQLQKPKLTATIGDIQHHSVGIHLYRGTKDDTEIPLAAPMKNIEFSLFTGGK